MIDFGLQEAKGTGAFPDCINGTVAEGFSIFWFLGLHINNELTWSAHTDKVVKSEVKRLFFLKRLRKFGMDPVVRRNVYRCTFEGLLTGCISVWYRGCTTKVRKVLGRVDKTAEHHIIGRDLQDTSNTPRLRKSLRTHYRLF